MTAEERNELRQAIDAARRHRVFARCDQGWHNPETGYRHGCRCDFCKIGTADARRVRKDRREKRRAVLA